mgnify:CR=1 FL=1
MRTGYTIHKETAHPLYQDGDEISTHFLEFYKRNSDGLYECPEANCDTCVGRPSSLLTHYESCKGTVIVGLGHTARVALSKGPKLIAFVHIFRQMLQLSEDKRKLVSFAVCQERLAARISADVAARMEREHDRTLRILKQDSATNIQRLQDRLKEMEDGLSSKIDDGFDSSRQRDLCLREGIQGVSTQVSGIEQTLDSTCRDIAVLKGAALSLVPFVCYKCTAHSSDSEALQMTDPDGSRLWVCQVGPPTVIMG